MHEVHEKGKMNSKKITFLKRNPVFIQYENLRHIVFGIKMKHDYYTFEMYSNFKVKASFVSVTGPNKGVPCGK